MADRIFDSSWVDRYVSNELTDDEALQFESALFDSDSLRKDVEAALSLQSILTLEETRSHDQIPQERLRLRSPLVQPFAMAASVLVGVFGLYMWYQSSSEVSDLQRAISERNQPYSEVALRRLDVMRSSGAAHLVRVPAQGGLLVLDIGLSDRVQGREQLEVDFIGTEGNAITSWRGSSTTRERVTLAIPAGEIHPGMATLEFLEAGKVIERWSLEIVDQGT